LTAKARLSMWKNIRIFGPRMLRSQQGQSLTEYLLVIAFIALAVGLVLGTWNGPLSKFLNSVAQIIVKTR
jgi:hypothetical protein